jgi:hypothetical protein
MKIRINRFFMDNVCYIAVSLIGSALFACAAYIASQIIAVFDVVHLCRDKADPFQPRIEVFSLALASLIVK